MGLIESLVFLYDMYVYKPFLQLPTASRYDKDTASIINDVYDRLMTWLQSYKQWTKGMVYLRVKYMQPLIQKLLDSDIAKEEMADLETRLTKARFAAGNTQSVDMVLEGERLVSSLNLSARRPGPGTSIKQSRTRYKREHTL